MNGEGISLVGPSFPFGLVGGMTPRSVPFANNVGLLTEDVSFFYDYTAQAIVKLTASLINSGLIIEATPYLSGNRTTVLPTGLYTATGNMRLISGAASVSTESGRIKKTESFAVTPKNLTTFNHIALITTGDVAFIVNLPTAVGKTGQEFVIKKVDTGAGVCTVTPAGAETIQGAAGYALPLQWNSVSLISNGANWVIVAAT